MLGGPVCHLPDELQALPQRIQNRNNKGLNDVVQLEQRTYQLSLQLLKGAIRRLRNLLCHIVKLPALSGRTLEGSPDHIKRDKAL